MKKTKSKYTALNHVLNKYITIRDYGLGNNTTYHDPDRYILIKISDIIWISKLDDEEDIEIVWKTSLGVVKWLTTSMELSEILDQIENSKVKATLVMINDEEYENICIVNLDLVSSIKCNRINDFGVHYEYELYVESAGAQGFKSLTYISSTDLFNNEK